MNVHMMLAVTAGGAVGALGRFLLMSGIGHWLGHGFPWATLVVNILGSFLFGVLIEVLALTWSPGEEVRAFLVIGVLGAFTTFSAFSLDVVTLMQRGEVIGVTFYVATSVVICVLALMGGMAGMRLVLA